MPALNTAFVKYNWKIKNVTRGNLEKCDKNNRLGSKYFQIWCGDKLCEWYLIIHCNDDKDALGLFFMKKKIDENVFLNFTVNLKDHQMKFEKNSNELKNSGWGWPTFIMLFNLFDPSKKYIDEEKCLTFDIEVKFSEVIGKTELKSNILAVESAKVVGSEYYNDKKFSDFTFKSSDGVDFPVHRIILADKSSVFMTMFTTEMEEKESKVAKFSDISSKTMKKVLQYIYTEKYNVEDVKSTTNVLYVAEKYELTDLKSLCINKLIEKVDESNALNILMTAELYDLKNLAQKCLSVIVNNFDKVKKSKIWSQLELPLIMKIFEEFDKRQNFAIETSIPD